MISQVNKCGLSNSSPPRPTLRKTGSTNSGLERRSNPPLVIPGAETHSARRRQLQKGAYIGLDWIRQKAPESTISAIEAALRGHWPGKPQHIKPVSHFQQTLKWLGGPQLSWGHPSQICLVDLPGLALAPMNGHEHVKWLSTFADLGTTPTRIDVAIDFVDTSIALGHQAEAACKRGELCGLRTWRPLHEYDSSGRQIRIQLNLGSRYSSKYVRIYDKGLEQCNREPGRHERLEAEFKKGHATAVVQAILAAGDDWPITLARLVFGGFDFRVRNRRSELKRRPRAVWYTGVLAGLEPIALKKQVVPTSFDTWRSGLARSYLAQLVALSEAIGLPLGSLVEVLASDVSPSGNSAKTAELLTGLKDHLKLIGKAERS